MRVEADSLTRKVGVGGGDEPEDEDPDPDPLLEKLEGSKKPELRSVTGSGVWAAGDPNWRPPKPLEDRKSKRDLWT